VIEQLLYDMDQASKLGVSMRAGDLRVYGSDGNRSAFEAMVEAGGQIQAMGLHVLNTGLMIGSFVPGPIGILSNGISMMLALANGDEATALEMSIGMVVREGGVGWDRSRSVPFDLAAERDPKSLSSCCQAG